MSQSNKVYSLQHKLIIIIMSLKKQSKSNTKKSGSNTGGGYKGPKGDEDSLGYNVFDYGKLNHNQYNKTLEAILSLIG